MSTAGIRTGVLLVGLVLTAGCKLSSFEAPKSEAVRTKEAGLSLLGNYGGMKAYTYVPSGVSENAPLVVALHGCQQSATDYVKAGWNEVASTHRFYVLYPEKPMGGCFAWYDPKATARGSGEVETLKAMVDAIKARYSIDPHRVFVTGLSAGGGMTVALLAAYPDVFAAGATFAGVPVGCAISCMFGRDETPQAWAAEARGKFPGYSGPRPRLSAWQGAEDSIVAPSNLTELMEQWTELVGMDPIADTSRTTGDVIHQEYKDSQGQVQVETWRLQKMGHGVPVQPGVCGAPAPYLLDVGVCSSLQAAAFFGLTVPR